MALGHQDKALHRCQLHCFLAIHLEGLTMKSFVLMAECHRWDC
jgi:hypothetical protein